MTTAAASPPRGHRAPDVLVEARGLVKRFGATAVVDGIDFEVRPGEFLGFLGPNGAGKTSTMRMIAAVSPPSAGTLRVFGLDPVRQGRRIRARLGVVHQEDNLDTELTVADNLFVYGRYFGLPRRTVRARAAELLSFARLTERAGERVERLSGGMRRRLAIARALINHPDLVLLDEPTTGLDPQARHLLWQRLDELKRRGVALVLTTHYMDEAEQLCDRLVVMDHGRIVSEGSPRDLLARHTRREVVELRFTAEAERDVFLTALTALTAHGEGPGAPAVRVESIGHRVFVHTDDGDRITAELTARGALDTASVRVRRSSLEDVFLTLTGRPLQD